MLKKRASCSMHSLLLWMKCIHQGPLQGMTNAIKARMTAPVWSCLTDVALTTRRTKSFSGHGSMSEEGNSRTRRNSNFACRLGDMPLSCESSTDRVRGPRIHSSFMWTMAQPHEGVHVPKWHGPDGTMD